MRLFAMCALIAVLLSGTARAQPVMDPDTEVARRDYQRGVAAYDQGDYEHALAAFLAAQQAHPSPALDYNIARCLDRLGRWREAADAYERYVTSQPNAPEAATLRERIGVLRARTPVNQPTRPTPPAAATPPDRPPAPSAAPASTPDTQERRSAHRLRLAAWIVGAGTLALAGAGAGVYGNAWVDYAARRDACQGQCAPDSLTGLRDRVQAAQIGSGVLFGLASAALVADVVLWTLSSRAARRARASLDPLHGKVHF